MEEVEDNKQAREDFESSMKAKLAVFETHLKQGIAAMDTALNNLQSWSDEIREEMEDQLEEFHQTFQPPPPPLTPQELEKQRYDEATNARRRKAFQDLQEKKAAVKAAGLIYCHFCKDGVAPDEFSEAQREEQGIKTRYCLRHTVVQAGKSVKEVEDVT